MSRFPAIPVAEKVDRATFEHEIKPGNRPVVLKGLVARWPIVEAARSRPGAWRLPGALRHRQAAKVAICPASQNGRFFYNDTVSGMNYRNIPGTVTQVVNRPAGAGRHGRFRLCPGHPGRPASAGPDPAPPDAAAGRGRSSAAVDRQFGADPDPFRRVGQHRLPRRRRQGLHPVPAGAGGQSLSRSARPDAGGRAGQHGGSGRAGFRALPKFHKALGHAQEARLEPGDALFIPALWWHHVRTTGPLNLLVNYW
ncbi:MAG: cupin-like domain-containing protein [Asticcacaulis sp.]